MKEVRGLKMMDCRLFEEQFFGTKRFDRTDSGEKIHVVSMAVMRFLSDDTHRLISDFPIFRFQDIMPCLQFLTANGQYVIWVQNQVCL